MPVRCQRLFLSFFVLSVVLLLCLMDPVCHCDHLIVEKELVDLF